MRGEEILGRIIGHIPILSSVDLPHQLLEITGIGFGMPGLFGNEQRIEVLLKSESGNFIALRAAPPIRDTPQHTISPLHFSEQRQGPLTRLNAQDNDSDKCPT